MLEWVQVSSQSINHQELIGVLPLRASLGEGLHWDAARQLLWCVDIHGQRIVCWDTLSPTWMEWRTAERIGWVIPEYERDTFLLGMQSGIVRASLATSSEVPIKEVNVVRPFSDPALRLNDAKADSLGAIWAGSLNNDDENRSDGALFRFDQTGQLHVLDEGYKVANGPAISPDGTWMLHTDSARSLIYRFDISSDGSRIFGKKIWKKFGGDEGHPDGMTFDIEGCVWVAHWAGGCVSRFDAEGRLLRRIHLPVSRITNVCFGGASLDRLFVTTAIPDGKKGAFDGSLLEIDSKGVRGLPGLCYRPARIQDQDFPVSA